MERQACIRTLPKATHPVPTRSMQRHAGYHHHELERREDGGGRIDSEHRNSRLDVSRHNDAVSTYDTPWRGPIRMRRVIEAGSRRHEGIVPERCIIGGDA